MSRVKQSFLNTYGFEIPNHFPALRTERDFNAYLFGYGEEGVLYEALRVAIVGAQNATPYGMQVAEMVAGWAAELGAVVVSGGARGCDAAAHRGAIEAGGKTVAVLGCGADVIYPARQESLFCSIAENGAVISEYEWGTQPSKHRFNERKRLIAALSDLVVVVEARYPSGTQNTVHHAIELEVPVAAVPGSILCLESAPPNKLITQGAYVITSKQDLSAALGIEERD